MHAFTCKQDIFVFFVPVLSVMNLVLIHSATTHAHTCRYKYEGVLALLSIVIITQANHKAPTMWLRALNNTD